MECSFAKLYRSLDQVEAVICYHTAEEFKLINSMRGYRKKEGGMKGWQGVGVEEGKRWMEEKEKPEHEEKTRPLLRHFLLKGETTEKVRERGKEIENN